MQAAKKYEVNTFQRLARAEMTGASALKKNKATEGLHDIRPLVFISNQTNSKHKRENDGENTLADENHQSIQCCKH